MSTTSFAYPGPDDTQRVEMNNGMTTLIRENRSSPVVLLTGAIPTGAIHDPADQAGLSSFVTSMLTRGSQRYDYDTFNEVTESVGASLTVRSDAHLAHFGIHCLSEDFPTMVEVLSDLLRYPVFPDAQIELVRRQRLVQLQEREEDTQEVASLRFYESIYGQHPYARPTSGYKESVGNVQRADLAGFHEQRYTPNGAIVAVSGDIDAQETLDLLGVRFGDWQGADADQETPAVVQQREPRRIDSALPGKVQSDIVIGCQAVARHHPDFYAVRVANTILGQFGMMGRLGERVREQEGLAYYAYSSMDSERAGGVWTAAAGVNPANVEQAIASILAEFARLRDEPVDAEELADSQAYMTGVVPLALETNAGIASTLLNIEWHDLGLDYLHRYNDLINGVSVEDVQRVAENYLKPDLYTLSVAGPNLG